jgi:transcriptional regulator with XRE-family HTH domain
MNGRRLREVRLLRGHTQESLGELIGNNARQIWRWESGETTPDADKVILLARALEVSADYLLGLSNDPSAHMSDLSMDEREVLSAMRRGDGMEAIRVIAGAKAKG